jgi:YD repeat-containing protein
VIPQAYLYPELPPAYPTTRVIAYTYDGLQRLTGANESPGTSYAYGYDNVGNRTSVQLNGGTPTMTTYNAANQVAGFTYDAASNLTDDGTATYGYDALGRLTLRNTTPYTYNGDRMLVFDGTAGYKRCTGRGRRNPEIGPNERDQIEGDTIHRHFNGHRRDVIYSVPTMNSSNNNAGVRCALSEHTIQNGG